MTAQTKIWTKADILALLDSSEKAVVRAIKGLYARQTADEQSIGNTKHHNSRGFNGIDARFLSDIAVKLPRYGDRMTDRQLVTARKMLKKYWRQLLEIAEENGATVSYETDAITERIANKFVREHNADIPASNTSKPAIFELYGAF